MVYLSLPSVNLRPHLVLYPFFSFKFRNTPDKFQQDFYFKIFCEDIDYRKKIIDHMIYPISYGSYNIYATSTVQLIFNKGSIEIHSYI